jgi:hypothetical protein
MKLPVFHIIQLEDNMSKPILQHIIKAMTINLERPTQRHATGQTVNRARLANTKHNYMTLTGVSSDGCMWKVSLPSYTSPLQSQSVNHSKSKYLIPETWDSTLIDIILSITSRKGGREEIIRAR